MYQCYNYQLTKFKCTVKIMCQKNNLFPQSEEAASIKHVAKILPEKENKIIKA